MKQLAIPSNLPENTNTSGALLSGRGHAGKRPIASKQRSKLSSVAVGWMLIQAALVGAPAVAESVEAQLQPQAIAQAPTSPEPNSPPPAPTAPVPTPPAATASPTTPQSEAVASPAAPPAASPAATSSAAPSAAGAPAANPETAPPAPAEASPTSAAQETLEPTETTIAAPEPENAAESDAPQEDVGTTYSQLLKDIEDGLVVDIKYDPRLNSARVTYEGKEEPIKVQLPRDPADLLYSDLLRDSEVSFDVQSSEDASRRLAVLGNLLIFLVIIIGLMLIIRRSAGVANQAMSFGKTRARFQMEAKTGVVFDDVAGVEEAKEELEEVVSFLKQPEKFTAIGAKIPKGMLLVGPPGTGKTLLAKAIAGEAGVPFFSMSGSEFVEMFVGVGASRVRDLFKKAKDNCPCLIFIDEIDAVGRKRGGGIGGGNDEREQTLNQLLTEMDGFEDNSGIIIIAATNRADVLDPALLRPGRFDRQVMVDLPTRQGRLGILQVHAKDKVIDPAVSMEAIARRTPGFSGADLANLLNEAAILTARRRKEAVTMLEVEDAIDRLTIGMKLKPLLDSAKKRLLAYHEIGHALLQVLLKDADKLNKVTIIPRSGGIGGFSQRVPNEENLDSGLYSRAWYRAQMVVTMGGRAAEYVVFGPDEITQGASSDIQNVTDMARAMITQLGMSSLGQRALEGRGVMEEDIMGRPDHSEAMALRIDQEIRSFVMEAYEQACSLLLANRELMDVLVDALVEQEILEGDEFRAIVKKYADLPKKRGYEEKPGEAQMKGGTPVAV